MLTFPALNGLAFYFSDKASIAPMAKTMLWMPVVNGILCALYLLLFLCFDGLVPPVLLAWGLAVAATGAWLVLVSRRKLLQGIASGDQFAFAAASTIVGAIFVAAAIYLLRSGEIGQHVLWSDRVPPLVQVIHRGSVKSVLFALCLAAFLLATAYLPMHDSIRGILAGLPIVPFGGLVSVAADTSSDRRISSGRYAVFSFAWSGNGARKCISTRSKPRCRIRSRGAHSPPPRSISISAEARAL